MNRSEKSGDEHAYTVTEDEQGYAATGRTEVKSQDEQGSTLHSRRGSRDEKSEDEQGYTVTG